MRDDMKFNITLCKLVKKYPALYDHTRSMHTNRNVKNRIWESIADQMMETVNDCKQQWKSIRTRYCVYLKNKELRSNVPKGQGFQLTYYLAPKLRFLDDFLLPCKSGSKNTHTAKLKPQSKKVAKATNPSPSSDSHASDAEASSSMSQKSPIARKTQNAVIDKDMSFLQSGVPDMKGMTPAQNRKFRAGILNIMRCVLDQQNARGGMFNA